ncbi:MAG: TonB-dependent receptor [Vicinamibacterales bacterium]|nr:TonB-dependent receptor [Vicinamibacterales bacterium]
MKARSLAFCLVLVLASPLPSWAGAFPADQPPPPQPPAEQPPPEEEAPPIYAEQVVVTASRVEQQLVNAPATVSVVTADVIASSPATNYAELLRSVPGMNITQISARDFNITMRGATSTLATSQLALLDGRSLYLDFFGFVAWDLLPVNPNELRQIEVIRGPASAVWGANALNGVINFISKTPRELHGDSLTISAGMFGRKVGNRGDDAGALFGVNGTHARAVNDRWAYKISAGGYSSDAFIRPAGTIPNGTGTQYPAFQNQGTRQPKVDGRLDYDDPDGRYRLTFSGGYAGTDGIIHTGIGPFDMERIGLGYGSMKYTRGAMRFSVFTNILSGDASALLAVGPTGQPIPFVFDTKTVDVEFGNVNTLGSRQVLTYGGNFRYNKFDLSIAPRGDNRSEYGAYVQDEFFLNDHVRLNVGARVDKFSVLDSAVFSPRTALILKPAADHSVRFSFNKAFRAPSLINNYLETTIINQLNLGLINPLFAGRVFNFPVNAVGNEALKEESTESYEIAYTGVIAKRATVTAAYYYTKGSDEIFFTQNGRYRAFAPPPGWTNALAPLPAATALGVLEVLPPACNPPLGPNCNTGGLPSQFTYLNLGEVKNKGVELGVDGAVSEALNVFVNYSYQFEPEPDFDLSEVNLPPQNRFNVGFNFTEGRFLGNAVVSYVGEARWQDVLDARFHGPTRSYTQVNGALGMRFAGGRIVTTIKAINLMDENIQSHIFGDILKRQVIGEVRISF